jgi:hypothetical protein
MSRASVLASGQRKAEAGMIDACRIRRRTGQGTDPVTGTLTPTYLAPDPYTGKCRVQQQTAIARPHDVGEDYVLVVRFDLQLPVVGSEGLRVGDEVTITASVNDPDLVGRVFLIQELAHKSEPTARRVGMIERTGS